MAAVLPLLSAWFLFCLILRRLRSVRLSFLCSSLIWAVFTYASTEILSCFHLINRTAIIVLWAMAAAALGVLLWRDKRPAPSLTRICWASFKTLDRTGRFFMAATALLLLLAGLSAVLSPPNVNDAVNYHMPRIMLWMENRSVEFFPTLFSAQLYLAPANEFFQLHFMSLEQGDVLVNCTQWYAWLGSLLAVSLILELLGAPPRMQAMGALLAASLPQGILVASSAKNDWSLVFWLLSFLVFGLKYGERPVVWHALAAGASASLVIATKGTSFVFLPAFALVLAATWHKQTWRHCLRHAAPAALCLLLFAPHAARNYRLYGEPLAPRTGTADRSWGFGNEPLSLHNTIGGLVRNVSLHFAISWPSLNARVNRLTIDVLAALGQNPDEPGATWPYQKFAVPAFRFDEIAIPNTAHLLLYVALAGFSLPARGRGRAAIIWWAACGLGALLFCALLRWQPWHTRLHLPLFVLGAVPAALTSERMAPRRLAAAVCAGLTIWAAWAAMRNDLRPLVGPRSVFTWPRDDAYFNDRSAWRDDRDAILAVRASGCRKVGIAEYLDRFEYPVFALLGVPKLESEVRFTGVSDSSAAIPQQFEPCAVICTNCRGWAGIMERYAARGFTAQRFGENLVFLKRAP